MRVNHIDLIKSYWNEHSGEYFQEHMEHLNSDLHPSWGLAHFPEAELGLLPADGGGRFLVDLGCGRGHDAVGYARNGYRVLAIDLSIKQIRGGFPHDSVSYLVANAEQLPLADQTADAVISDHGAFDHSIPEQLLKESFRVLKPAGILVICTYSPIALSAFDMSSGRITEKLLAAYPTGQMRSDGRSVMPSLGFGSWFHAITAAGFVLGRVLEPLFDPDRYMYYDQLVSPEWASRWPVDIILMATRPHTGESYKGSA